MKPQPSDESIWHEGAWRRSAPPPADTVQERLESDPAARAQWEEELALTAALGKLPDLPLSSNFNSQVLQRVAAGERERARLTSRNWFTWRIRPAWLAASTACLLLASWGGVTQWRGQQRARLAASVALVSRMTAPPGPDVFQDFEAIRRLNMVPVVSDDDLLAALE